MASAYRYMGAYVTATNLLDKMLDSFSAFYLKKAIDSKLDSLKYRICNISDSSNLL